MTAVSQERFQIIQERQLKMRAFIVESMSRDLSNLYVAIAFLKKWSSSSDARQFIQVKFIADKC